MTSPKLEIDQGLLLKKMQERLGEKEAEISALYVAIEQLGKERDEALADNTRLREKSIKVRRE